VRKPGSTLPWSGSWSDAWLKIAPEAFAHSLSYRSAF